MHDIHRSQTLDVRLPATSRQAPPIQLSHLSFIAQFTTDVQHVRGPANVVADALSRSDAVSVVSLDYSALAQSQENDAELRELLEQSSSLHLQQVAVPRTNIKLYCHVKTPRPRTFITAPIRHQAFDSLHGLSHPGTKASARLVSERFAWPHLQKGCYAWARTCQQCHELRSPCTLLLRQETLAHHELVSSRSTSISLVLFHLQGPTGSA
ncbi:hypothetical protein M514_11635 [Trichuris suis]|uniref:Integrase zinc-binding domain-containing protein n=1 Tax=Trichuris suis TaxID=68888 RepID=A0A085N3A4_9BILA|nr:hypothetical protein M513_11635 [Trichuris suis]KFD63950.1 hypothetical protein M514_11635 [Trichuris suis]KHJ42501.1 hypothetical protein D918_07423 [Trichuris suis]